MPRQEEAVISYKGKPIALITETKVCRCTNAIAQRSTFKVDTNKWNGADEIVTVTVSYFPGNVCQKCGTPWKVEVRKLEYQHPRRTSAASLPDGSS